MWMVFKCLSRNIKRYFNIIIIYHSFTVLHELAAQDPSVEVSTITSVTIFESAKLRIFCALAPCSLLIRTLRACTPTRLTHH